MSDEQTSSFQQDENDQELNYLLEQQSEFVEIPTPDFDDSYRNVKALVYDGFIPVRAQINGMDCVLKALNPNEFRYIDLLTNKDQDKVALYFLYSAVMLDGLEVLRSRENFHSDVIEIFRTLPSATVNRISRLVLDVHKYYSSCYDELEGYLYEDESRYRWIVYKREAMNATVLHGLPKLGFNTAQEVWISFNQREDMREEEERRFAHSKFIASSMVGSKEIKKIELRERMRWSEELKRRQEVRLKKKTDRIVLTKSLSSAKDLVDELHRQIRGEKDIHDKIIEQHEAELAKLADKRRRDLEELKIQAAMKWSASDPNVMGGSRAITQKEMDTRTSEINNQKWQIVSEDAEKYLNKVAATSTMRGNVAPNEGQVQTPDGKRSIFDTEVQDALRKLKSE